jgi:tetraacyldisaccharide 4'-kinase
VVSRGYRTPEGEVPDELAALARDLPDLRWVRDPDRVRGALTAIEKHLADAVVLDDAFQHHRIRRQLDLLAVDATNPFGGGHCLPRGLLREPVREVRRAGAVVVTRSDQVPAATVEALLRRLRRLAPRAALATAVHAPARLTELRSGEERPTDWLRDRAVLPVSGLGNPAAFERTLADLGARLAGALRFPDHHEYPESDLARVRTLAGENGVEAVVTTAKDAVKWGDWPDAGPPALVLEVRVRFASGEEEVRDRLRVALRGSSAGV